MFRAVVFAYSEVGVRCLAALIEHRVQVPLVVTHEDSPTENAWFGSVADLADKHGIEVVTAGDDPNGEAWVRRAGRARAGLYLLVLLSRALERCASRLLRAKMGGC